MGELSIGTFMGPIDNHRKREKGVLVYPVYSRRSGGLSVGINLFPGRKCCSFDCPYCEVFPFSNNSEFSVEFMEDDLCQAIASALERSIPVRDICFSGNGEPTLSPDFPLALERAGCVRESLVSDAELVLITNGSFLLEEKLFSLLARSSLSLDLNIWLKLDAGTSLWYKKINRSVLPFEKIIEKVKEFAASAPVTIQTMICAVDGEGPPKGEAEAWEKLLVELVSAGNAKGNCGVRKVQIYGKARPAPGDPKASALPVMCLEERAASLRAALASAFACEKDEKNRIPPIDVYP
jgi:wyosine [tRNA(Phe)-imidazoG37] synthetase (radical SAM superfamily)